VTTTHQFEDQAARSFPGSGGSRRSDLSLAVELEESTGNTHRVLSPIAAPHPTRSSGELGAAISNAVVQITAEFAGRGATRAKTYLFDDVILTVMEGSALPVERTLAKAGEGQLVHQVETRIGEVLADRLSAAVEEITGRRVRACMCGAQIESDLKCQVFMLASEPQ